MQIDHLLLFNEIAKEKSISKVAAASHISQPALSQQMQRLEDEIGLKLFARSNRGIELTEAGKVVQKYALQMLQTYGNLKEEIENFKQNNRTFRISATNVVANYAMPCIFYKVNQRFPNYTFSLNSMPSREVILSVLENNAELGFVAGSISEPGLISSRAYSDKIHLVASSSCTVGDTIGLKELKQHPLILLNECFTTYGILMQHLSGLGYGKEKLNILYHLDSTEAVKASVMNRFGLAFLPYMAIKKELLANQLKIVNIVGFDLEYDISMIHKPKDDLPDPSLYDIIRYFETTANKAIC